MSDGLVVLIKETLDQLHHTQHNNRMVERLLRAGNFRARVLGGRLRALKMLKDTPRGRRNYTEVKLCPECGCVITLTSGIISEHECRRSQTPYITPEEKDD